jgi:hypothetical protein
LPVHFLRFIESFLAARTLKFNRILHGEQYTRDSKFWMVGLDGTGKDLWSSDDVREEASSLLCLDMVATEDDVFVLTCVIYRRQHQKPTFKLGLLKLSPRM